LDRGCGISVRIGDEGISRNQGSDGKSSRNKQSPCLNKVSFKRESVRKENRRRVRGKRERGQETGCKHYLPTERGCDPPFLIGGCAAASIHGRRRAVRTASSARHGEVFPAGREERLALAAGAQQIKGSYGRCGSTQASPTVQCGRQKRQTMFPGGLLGGRSACSA
jgi:hypothetical protein